MQNAAPMRVRWSMERRFHLGFALLMMAAALLGFARTFFLRWWFPEWVAVHAAPEPFFYFHGVLFFSWLLLLVTQASLVAAGRVDVHRRLGAFGAVLAAAMVIVGVFAALIAARRPTGFTGVPVPPLKFLAIPLADIALFGVFVALAIVKRRKVQSHKRYILLASIVLLDAAIARWPFSIMTTQLPLPGLTVADLFVDLFFVPMVIWDLISLGRPHRVTLWGGLAFVIFQPMRFVMAETHAWLAFASWAVSLLGH